MNSTEREELRRIQQELRQPLAASAHKIRDLPGTSDLYIFLPWQAVRDRLEEVVPDYQLSFSDPVYDQAVNLVSIQASIEILGVKKSAIAAVKISIISNKGNNAERGHCIDRLHAEAIKNVGEAWCVGRYLDDQIGVYKMLCEQQSELDAETKGKLNQMKSQFFKKLREYSTPQTARATPTATPKKRENIDPRQDRRNHESIPVSSGEIALYPQHRLIIERVRSRTGHTSHQIEEWCAARGKDGSANLDLELVQELAADLALGWGESKFPSPELAEASYRGKVATLTASGMSLHEAIAAWMEAVEPVKV